MTAERPARFMPYSTNPMAEQDGAPRLEIVCRAVEVATDGDIAGYGLALALRLLRRLSRAEREMLANVLAQWHANPGQRPELAKGAVAEMLSQSLSQNALDRGV
jgi:hypothetical protein